MCKAQASTFNKCAYVARKGSSFHFKHVKCVRVCAATALRNHSNDAIAHTPEPLHVGAMGGI
eukprot:1651070-Alexandrium_andersonii.AAC.1